MKRQRLNRASQRFLAGQRQRAMTMVEILVAIGAMVVILGVAYGMVIESERASRKIAQREASMQYCQRVIEQVSATLRAAVPPSAFKAGVAKTGATFEASRFSVMTLDRESTGGLMRVTIGLDPEAHDGAGAILRRLEAVDGENVTVSEDDFYMALAETSRVELEFGYAGPQKPDMLANYQATWPGGDWPSLVRVVVRVKSGSEDEELIELETAVIPSMVPRPAKVAVMALPIAPATTTSDDLTTMSREVTQ